MMMMMMMMMMNYESFNSTYGDFCPKLWYLQLISAFPPAWKKTLFGSNTNLGDCRPSIKL